jgi:hypothetical protein
VTAAARAAQGVAVLSDRRPVERAAQQLDGHRQHPSTVTNA